MTQKDLFGSVVKAESTVVKKKTEPKKAKKQVTIKPEAVSVPSQAEVVKKYREMETREEIVKRYINSYCFNIDFCYNYSVNTGMFNRCCENLENALDNKLYNREIVDTLKRIIESANLDRFQMLYVYASMNMVIVNYINEVYPMLDTFMIFNVIDRAYGELIYYGE